MATAMGTLAKGGEMTQHISLRSDFLWLGDQCIGGSDLIYAYPGEQATLGGDDARVVVRRTPGNVDLLFVVGSRVVGCEVKRIDDLVHSHASRRLHRQLRTLLALVDVPCLVVRNFSEHELAFQVEANHRRPDWFWGDWVNWQTRGVYILPVPLDNYLDRLLLFRDALKTDGRRALAGTDQRAPREHRAGWLLRRVRGIGPKISAQLLAQYNSPMAVFMAAERGEIAPTFGRSIEQNLVAAMRE